MTITNTSQINTNNAWGFGGIIATEKTYANGYKSVIGKACYRHTGTSPVERFYDNNGDAISKEVFLQKINPTK
jgi:hypothetical protein